MEATGIDKKIAGDGTRTRNLLITNQLLCQLSYTSVFIVTAYVIRSLAASQWFGWINLFGYVVTQARTKIR